MLGRFIGGVDVMGFYKRCSFNTSATSTHNKAVIMTDMMRPVENLPPGHNVLLLQSTGIYFVTEKKRTYCVVMSLIYWH